MVHRTQAFGLQQQCRAFLCTKRVRRGEERRVRRDQAPRVCRRRNESPHRVRSFLVTPHAEPLLGALLHRNLDRNGAATRAPNKGVRRSIECTGEALQLLADDLHDLRLIPIGGERVLNEKGMHAIRRLIALEHFDDANVATPRRVDRLRDEERARARAKDGVAAQLRRHRCARRVVHHGVRTECVYFIHWLFVVPELEVADGLPVDDDVVGVGLRTTSRARRHGARLLEHRLHQSSAVGAVHRVRMREAEGIKSVGGLFVFEERKVADDAVPLAARTDRNAEDNGCLAPARHAFRVARRDENCVPIPRVETVRRAECVRGIRGLLVGPDLDRANVTNGGRKDARSHTCARHRRHRCAAHLGYEAAASARVEGNLGAPSVDLIGRLLTRADRQRTKRCTVVPDDCLRPQRCGAHGGEESECEHPADSIACTRGIRSIE